MKFTLGILIVSAFFLAGCLEAPVEPNAVIKGTVLFYNWPDEPTQWTFVSMKDLPICETTYKGTFQFSYVSTPYNLIVSDGDNQPSTKYLGLTNLHPFVYSLDYTRGGQEEYIVAVNFPPVPPNRIVYLQCLSNSSFFQTNYFLITDHTIDSMIIHLNPPPHTEVLWGKLLYLQAEIDPNTGQTITYEKVGLTNLETSGFNVITFYSNDILPVTGTTRTGFSITGNQNNSANTNAFLTFPNMSKDSEMDLANASSDSHIRSVLTPMLNGINYQIKIVSGYSSNDYSQSNWAYVSSGGNAQISFDQPFSLILPANNQTNVTDTTTFEISDQGKPGVYFYWINSFLGIMNNVFVTDKKIVKFADFEGKGIHYYPNTRYYGYVSKYSEYRSIDDFVSTNYIYDPRYNSFGNEYFQFTTAP